MSILNERNREASRTTGNLLQFVQTATNPPVQLSPKQKGSTHGHTETTTCWVLSAEVRVQSLASPCDICDGSNGTCGSFSL